MIRGVRGATTVPENQEKQIIERSYELMKDLIQKNSIDPEDVVNVYFTVTADLNDTFPAKSLRKLEGWTYVPVMCMREINVPNSLERCVRVMVTVHTDKSQREIKHIYHYEAKKLRPDLKSQEE